LKSEITTARYLAALFDPVGPRVTRGNKPDRHDANWPARIKRCSAHGRRKNAAQKLAEAGCDIQIMSVTGHRTVAMALRSFKPRGSAAGRP
jgi:hypothetical protein